MSTPETQPVAAAIVDVDGTLCDVTSILHYVDGTHRDDKGKPIKNFDAFHGASQFCPPNQQALDFIERAHAEGLAIVIVTARMEQWRFVTTKWLQEHIPGHIPWTLHMRSQDDYRKDTIIKREIYNRLVDYGIDVHRAIDDNPNVVQLWESLDIPTEVVPRPTGDTSLQIEKANQEGHA